MPCSAGGHSSSVPALSKDMSHPSFMIEHMFDTLKKATAGILEVEPAHLSDGELEEGLVQVHRTLEMLQAAWLGYVAEFDRRGRFGRDGTLSVSAWLVRRCRLAWSVARERVGVARSLQQMPLTEQAYREGDLTFSHLRVLVRAREANRRPSLPTSRPW